MFIYKRNSRLNQFCVLRILASKINLGECESARPTGPLGPERVPHVAVEVVIAGQQKAAGLAERHAGDAADDVVVAVHAQLLVGPDVEHATGRVVTSGCKSIAVREKLQRTGGE